MFIVSQFHILYLVPLAFLPVVLNLPFPIAQHFSEFSDLSLKTSPFVLEAYGHFPDLAIDHGFSLAFHHVSKFFEFLRLAPFGRLVPTLPLLYFLNEVLVLLLFIFEFLFESIVDFAELGVELLVVMVKALANIIQFLHFVSNSHQNYLYSYSLLS